MSFLSRSSYPFVVSSIFLSIGDGSPAYLGGMPNWYFLEGNFRCQEPKIVNGQQIYHIYNKSKIIIILRHPTPRYDISKLVYFLYEMKSLLSMFNPLMSDWKVHVGLFPYFLLHVPSLSFGRDTKPRPRVNRLTVPAR